jgi:hypothetical protein
MGTRAVTSEGMRTTEKAGIINNWKKAASNRGLFLDMAFFSGHP